MLVHHVCGVDVKLQLLGGDIRLDDGFQIVHHLGQGGLLLLDLHLAALNAAHVQHVVNEAEQVVAGGGDLGQVVLDLLGVVDVGGGQGGEADDGVHGGADVVGHVVQEGGLGPVGVLGGNQGVLEIQPLLLQLDGHGLGVVHVQEQPHKGDGGAVLPPGQPPGGVEPPPAGVLGEQAVFHVVGGAAGVVPHCGPVGSQHTLPVLIVEQLGPGFQQVGEVLLTLIAQHVSEYVGPGARHHFGVLVKVHVPLAGAHGGVDHLHGGLLLLDLGVGRPDAVPVRLFPGEQDLGVAAVLGDEGDGHAQRGRQCDGDLDDAAAQHAGADGADLVVNDIVPDQDGEHPAGALHRDIAQILVPAPVAEGNLPHLAGVEIVLQLLVAVAGVQL